MKASFLPLLAAVFLSTSASYGNDLELMAGKWEVERVEAGGKEIETDAAKDLVITIYGDRYELIIKNGMDGGTLKLDESQSPKAMDATDTEGEDVGKVIKAIYEIEGDTMRICYAWKGGDRPTEMATAEGSPTLLVTYRRQK